VKKKRTPLKRETGTTRYLALGARFTSKQQDV